MIAGMDYGYVSPIISFTWVFLMIVLVLLVGLAWYNFKGLRKDFQDFLKAELVWRQGNEKEKERLAMILDEQRKKEYQDFFLHMHDANGRVILMRGDE
jgi:hypothetical protein